MYGQTVSTQLSATAQNLTLNLVGERQSHGKKQFSKLKCMYVHDKYKAYGA